MTCLRTVAVGLTLVLGARVHAADRLALVVGNNHGGGSKPALRYAERDAQQVAQVLRDLGGVGRVRVLLGRSAADLRRAFDEVKSEARDRSVLFFFYSGHADEDALQLGDTRLGFKELRSRLKAMPARVAVAFVDACQSGQVIGRAKGGRSVSTVNVRFAGDSGSRGRVFISSSAADEGSQESDALRASYFTHYLVSALRGAADESGDRRVSLEETYRFVYRHTLERTSRTLVGPQHPTYDVRMVGRGQLVLTELPAWGSVLVLAAPTTGTFLVYRRHHGELVAEVRKDAKKTVRIALAPGSYEVRRLTPRGAARQLVEVPQQTEVTLDGSRMVAFPLEVARAKGTDGTRPMLLGLGYAFHNGYLEEAGLVHGGRASLMVPAGPLDLGAVLGVGAGGYVRSDGIDVSLQEVRGGGALAWRFWRWKRFGLVAAMDLGLGWVRQVATLAEQQPQHRSGLFGWYHGGVGAEVRVWALQLGLRGTVGQVVIERADGWSGPLTGGLEAGVQLEL